MEGFKIPDAPNDENKPESSERSESVELTLEEKYKLVGKKDSVLDKRGIHISIAKLDYLLASGLVIADISDTDAVVAAIIDKLDEEREIKRLEEIQEDVKFRKNEIRKYVTKYGLNEMAKGLIEEWKEQSLNWVRLDGTIRAQIIHKLRISELYRAAGDPVTGVSSAREAYDLAVDEADIDMVSQIVEEFPEFNSEEE